MKHVRHWQQTVDRYRNGNGTPHFRCPACGEYPAATVIDSRVTTDGIRRRRICEQCNHRFTTYERLEKPERINIGALKSAIQLTLKSIREIEKRR